jgi:hypothetical protein
MNRRMLWALAAGAAALGLAGCAAVNQVWADVSSFGEWPGSRAPGSYAFERLPSQQAQAELQQQLEDAARPALEKAGFKPAAAGAEPEVLVQVGARVSRAESSPWDDPLWWHGGFGAWRHGPWRGPYWGATWRIESARYEREVAVLIRDRASGKPIHEARASNEGFQGGGSGLLKSLYAAALFDFPALGINPRRVTVPVAP